MKTLKIALIFSMLLLFSGCGSATNPQATTVISVTPPTACLTQNSQQQFLTSEKNVNWQTETSIGTVTKDGLFTAGNKTALGLITASKGNSKGSATVVVVPKKENCSAQALSPNSASKESDQTRPNNEENSTTDEPDNSSDTSSPTDINKWSAYFEAKITYEIKGNEEFIGSATHEVNGGFFFTIDYQSKKLEIVKPAGGYMTVNVIDDVPECNWTVLTDPFIWIENISGSLNDTEFVFNKDFVTGDHDEGLQISCPYKNIPMPQVSTIQMISDNAFPVSIDAQNGASAPIQGSFAFSGRQAIINGTLSVHEIKD